MLSAIFAVAFLCLCVQAGVKDMVSLTIPNWMNLTILVLFFPAALVAGIGWETFGVHLLVGGVALIVAFGLFAFNVFGGGDAKMIPGVLLWIGPAGVMHFLLGMAVVGGLLTVLLLMMRNLMPAEVAPGFAQKVLNKQNGVPYGVAIAAGAFLAAPQSALLIDFVNKINGLS